jgi:hypothetical protein
MRNRNWVFGHGAGLTFSPTPATFTAPHVNTYEGCASISDASGNLILYSDGVTLWDGAGTPRATGLLGNDSSTQSALIVPDPASAHRYFIFTTAGANGGNHHFNGIRVDTNTWVTTPLSSLMVMPATVGLSPTEKLTAVIQPTSNSFWILTVVQSQTTNGGETGPGILRVFRLTPGGISHFNDQPLQHWVGDIGYMKATSGSHCFLALANMWLSNLLVIPFSNVTGMITTSAIVTLPVLVPPYNTAGFPYGVEFGANGKMLYFSTFFLFPTASSPTSDGHIFQYKLGGGPSVLVGTHPNNQAGDYALGALQLADDGRIYIAQDGETKLGVIAHPDLPGTACALTFGSLQLSPGTLCKAGLPNMIRDLAAI